MKFASGISVASDAAEAVTSLGDDLERDLAGQMPDLLAVFISPQYAADYDTITGRLRDRFPGATFIGGSAAGVIGGRREVEHRRALSAVAAHLPDVRIRAHHVRDHSATNLGFDDTTRAFIVIPDPFSCDATRLVADLDRRFATVPKIGGVASGGRFPGDVALFLDEKRFHDGALIIGLEGALTVDTVIAQGCRPIGDPMLVTACENNLILELGSTKPTDMMAKVYEGLSQQDRELFATSVFMGIEMKDQVEYHSGDWLIRNIIGIERERGAIAIGGAVEQWNAVQFHLRDKKTSADDVGRMLDRYTTNDPTRAPAGALLFSCLGRGTGLYGAPDFDSDAFFNRFGDIPLAGFFGNGEIGPVGGTTFLHGYTSAFGIFSTR